jgi:hypothetical protein
MSDPASDNSSQPGTQTPTRSDDYTFLVDRLQHLEHKRPKIFRWKWILWTGALVVACVGLWLALPHKKREVQGLIRLREERWFVSEEEYEGYRKNQVLILKSRELLTRTVNDPAVSDLEMIKRSNDPVRLLEENIFVFPATPTVFAVCMKAARTDEIKIIVDTLMKCYVDHVTTIDRRERAEELLKLEKLASELDEQSVSTRREMKKIEVDPHFYSANKIDEVLSQRLRELERRLIHQYEALKRIHERIAHLEISISYDKPCIRESARESNDER